MSFGAAMRRAAAGAGQKLLPLYSYRNPHTIPSLKAWLKADGQDRPVTLTNLIKNPRFQTNLAGWANNNGQPSGGTVTRVSSPWDADGYALHFDGTAVGTQKLVVRYDQTPGLEAGKTYQFGCRMRVIHGETSGNAGMFGELTAHGTSGYDAIVVSNPSHVALTAGDIEISGQYTVPASGYANDFILDFGAVYSSSPDGHVEFLMDRVYLVQSEEPVTFFDGDSEGGSWVGTPGASASTKTVWTGYYDAQPIQNLVTHPNFEIDGNWGISGPNSTVGYTTDDHFIGSRCYKVTVTGVSDGNPSGNYAAQGTFSAPSKRPITLSAWVKGTAGRTLMIAGIRDTFEAGSEYTGDQNVEKYAVATGQWQRISVTIPSPTNGHTPRFFNFRVGPGDTPQIGDVVYFDAVTAVYGTAVHDFFDGNSAGASWDGAPNASTSHQRQRRTGLSKPLTNKITNGRFLTDTAGWDVGTPDDFTPHQVVWAGEGGAVLSRDTGTFGFPVAKLVFTDNHHNYQGMATVLPGVFKAGVTYTVMARVSGTGQGSFQIGIGDNVSRIDVARSPNRAFPSFTWMLARAEWTPTADRAAGDVSAWIQNNAAAAGTGYVTDFMVFEGTGDVDYFEGTVRVPIEDGDVVPVWGDSSGDDVDATQRVTAQQPTYVAKGINKLPALHFDGANDYLNLPDMAVADGVTVLIVIKRDGDGYPGNPGYSGLWHLGSGASNTHFPWPSVGIYDDAFTPLRKTLELSAKQYAAIAKGQIYEVEASDSTWRARLSGTPLVAIEGTAAQTALINPTNPRVGVSHDTAYAIKGQIAEILWFDAVLTDEERSGVEGYLAQKYGIFVEEPPSARSIFGSKVAAWFDASRLRGLLSGEEFSPWTDASGKKRHAVSTAHYRPTFLEDGPNGWGVVEFDGVLDSVKTPSFSLGSSELFFAVVQLEAAQNYPMVLSGNLQFGELRFHGSTGHPSFSISDPPATDPTAHVGDWVLLVGRYDETSHDGRLWVNGEMVAGTVELAGPPLKNQAAALNIAGRDGQYLFKGKIAEAGVVAASGTTGQRRQLEAALAKKWGLTWLGDFDLESISGLLLHLDATQVKKYAANHVPNPSFEVDLTGWMNNNTPHLESGGSPLATLTRSTTVAYKGSASMKIVATSPNNGAGRGARTVALPEFSDDHTYTAIVRMRGEVGGEIVELMFGADGGAHANGSDCTCVLTTEWQTFRFGRYYGQGGAAGWTHPFIAIRNANGATTETFYVDTVRLAIDDNDGTYFDGDDPGCEWVGTPHESASRRESPVRNGDLLSVWKDRSSHGSDAVQDSPGFQPVYIEDFRDGTPAVWLTQVGVRPGFMAIPGADALSAQPGHSFTVFFVTQSNDGLLLSRDAGPGNRDFSVQAGGMHGPHLDIAGNGYLGEGVVDLTVPHVMAVSFTHGEGKAYIDGAKVGATYSGSLDGNVTSADLLLGRREYPGSPIENGGKVMEIIAYDHVLSDADRVKVEKYLLAKWGTPEKIRTPTEILGADLAQWQRADDVPGGKVSTWPDASGNGRDMVQPVDAARPFQNGGRTPTGGPAIVFDGVDDFLLREYLYTEGQHELPQPWEMWVVLRLRSQPPRNDGRHLFGYGQSCAIHIYDGPYLNVPPGSFSGDYGTTGGSGTWNAWRLVADNADNRVFLEIAEQRVAETTHFDMPGQMWGMAVGKDPSQPTPADVDVAEILIVKRALTPEDSRQMWRYLHLRHGIGGGRP